MSRQVLLVDDAEDIRAITQLGLEMSRGWSVIATDSGLEAISLASYYQPDVILLDMMMPSMDGRSTLHSLKGNFITQSIPVIIVTAKDPAWTPNDMEQLGVKAILRKPFRPLQLADQICHILGWQTETGQLAS